MEEGWNRSSSWFSNCNECIAFDLIRPIDRLHAIIGAWLTVGRALASNCIVPEKSAVRARWEVDLGYGCLSRSAKGREKKKDMTNPVVCRVNVAGDDATMQSASNVSVAFISCSSFRLFLDISIRTFGSRDIGSIKEEIEKAASLGL